MTGFGGEVPAYYHAYRHGYPAGVIDALVGIFGLTGQDVVVHVLVPTFTVWGLPAPTW